MIAAAHGASGRSGPVPFQALPADMTADLVEEAAVTLALAESVAAYRDGAPPASSLMLRTIPAVLFAKGAY